MIVPALHILSETPIKLVVWDLDETLWSGTLLEGGGEELRPKVYETIVALDERGILQSIASRNDAVAAAKRLDDLGLKEFFLVPEVGWSAKSIGVKRIAQRLDIHISTVLFVDDSEFELAEVAAECPSVRTINVRDLDDILALPGILGQPLTKEAAARRKMYMQEIERHVLEENFQGPPEAFMASLELELTIRTATLEDLARVEELIVRTNQLNSTGTVYGRDYIEGIISAGPAKVLVAELADRFGHYGNIGVVVITDSVDAWQLQLVLVSCRVMSRNVASTLLSYLATEASKDGKHLKATFRDTGRNRAMKMAFMMAGLKRLDETTYASSVRPPPIPSFYKVTAGTHLFCDQG